MDKFGLLGPARNLDRLRNIAFVVLAIGVVMFIAGAIMLGVGIRQKHDADKKVCSSGANGGTSITTKATLQSTSQSNPVSSKNLPDASSSSSKASISTTNAIVSALSSSVKSATSTSRPPTSSSSTSLPQSPSSSTSGPHSSRSSISSPHSFSSSTSHPSSSTTAKRSSSVSTDSISSTSSKPISSSSTHLLSSSVSSTTASVSSSSSASTSTSHSLPTSSTSSTRQPASCPPCSCSSTVAASTKHHVPFPPTVQPSTPKPVHRVSIFTVATHNYPSTNHPVPVVTLHPLQTTTHNYPNDPSFTPCKTHIVVAFENSLDVTDSLFARMKDYIVGNLISWELHPWNHFERLAYASFGDLSVDYKAFYHMSNKTEFTTSVESVKKRVQFTTYKKLFDVLINQLTLIDTNNEFVNTIIFTADGTPEHISEVAAAAAEVNRRGRLIVVSMDSRFNSRFTPWVGNNVSQIIDFNKAGSDDLTTWSIMQQFKCPTGSRSV